MGSTPYTLVSSKQKITEKTADASGLIAIEKGFKGWVILPFSSYTRGDGSALLGHSETNASLRLLTVKNSALSGCFYLLDDVQTVYDFNYRPVHLEGKFPHL
jgi:hypothetical protein